MDVDSILTYTIQGTEIYAIQGTENYLKNSLQTRLAEEKRDFASILRRKTEEAEHIDRYRTHAITNLKKFE
jgi:hypothetical protein